MLRYPPRIIPMLFLFLLLVANLPQAFATQVIPVSLKQMAQESRVIIHARVQTRQVQWNKAGNRILTLTQMRILNGIKGSETGSTITLYQVGGELDGTTQKIHGALPFAKGEEIILFAQPFKDKLVTYGMGLGKYVVTRTGGAAMVEPEFGDVNFVDRSPNGSVLPRHTPPQTAQPLDLFVSQIQTWNKSQAGEVTQ